MLQFTGERFIPSEIVNADEIGIEHLHRYHSIIPFIRNKTVLDIACGEGYGTALIGKYAKNVTGVDKDETCIEWASGHYAASNNKLNFKQGTVISIPLDNNTIDVAISFETIEHLNEAEQRLFMQEIKRVLKPEGMLIISTTNTEVYSTSQDQASQPQVKVKEFKKEAFRSFLQEYFNYTYHFEQGYEAVSAITGDELNETKQLQVYNWNKELRSVNRKYLISLAAGKEVADTAALSSAVIQVDKDFWGMMDYIRSLQKEQEQLKNTSQELVEEKEDPSHLLSQANARLAEKEGMITDLNHKLITLHQQLDELNNKLSEIYSSEGYKLLSVYYRFKARILPENSKQYKQLKKLVNKLRRKRNDIYATYYASTPLQFDNSVITAFDPFEFPVYDHPKVSIIIPVYNGWEMNYRCLRSILKNTHGVSYEVIIADDVSVDETANIKDYIKNITVVRNETNLGFLKNCNNAAKHARGAYIHFLNNDTQVTTGWLSSLTELLDNNPDIGMVGSKLVYPNGRLQEAGGIIWQDASGWNFGHSQSPEAPEFNYVKEVDYISGASIMLRKKTWDALHGFDEHFSPAYCEDTDLAFQIRKLNMKVVYQPLSVVVHHEGFSHGTDEKPNQGLTGIKQYQKLNNFKLKEKWSDELKKQFPNATEVFWARDRSKGKKTILVVDHYVPTFDKDAGSRTTYQYLQLFVQMGMNVKFITNNFAKSEPYTTALQQLGIEVLYGNYYASNWQQWVIDNKKYFDFVLLNRPHIATKYIKFFKENTNATIFYYGHDLHFVRERNEYMITGDKKKLSSSKEWKAVEYALFEKADITLTPTLKEKQIIAEAFPAKQIEVMPAFFYEKIAPAITNFDKRMDLLFIGGFVHPPNVDAVIWFIDAVLPEIRKSIPRIRFIVAGSNPPDKVLSYASDNVVIKGFVSDKELTRLYDSIKIAVIPLRFGAGLKGKTVEAMAKSIPIVSTASGLEGIEDLGELVQPHDNPADLAKAIIDLYTNNEALEQQSAWLNSYASKHFTREVAGTFFRKLFKLEEPA
jgi:GT2 family glycosyltransferase/ubiquinone/menaquinone biosynthesis C-methylase UbiE